MADNWEDEEYEEALPVKPDTVNDEFQGEDEDDDVKDNWDDDSDDDKPKPVAAPKEKKKPLKERIAEKEALKQAQREERLKKEAEAKKEMTAEEIAAEKARAKLRDEEDNLMLTKDMLGVGEAAHGIESMNPQTVEEFTEFANKLKKKITQSQAHPLYHKFLEDMFRDLCIPMTAEDTKKIGSTLTTLANEKLKLEKSKQGKSKKKKMPEIKQVRSSDFGYGEGGEYDDEYEDFM